MISSEFNVLQYNELWLKSDELLFSEEEDDAGEEPRCRWRRCIAAPAAASWKYLMCCT